METKDFIEKQVQEVLKFRSALTKETDRGCALFASSYLDKALSDLLYCALANDKNIESDLFEGSNAPLSSFSARIKMAYYLGKISKTERRDLDLIRKIRNYFAHNATPIDFESLDPDISSRCKELSFSYHDKDYRPRGHFTAACLRLLAHIHVETLKCEAPIIKADNPLTNEQKSTFKEDIDKALSMAIKSEPIA